MAISPIVSLIVPCYRVGRYLPDFLKSIDEQDIDSELFELIFVIDGCPEDSEEIVRRWASSSSWQARIIVTDNRGVSSARNTGLERASGTWVTFPDPDDMLGSDYLLNATRSLREHRDIALLATRLVRISEGTRRSLGHVLDYRYSEGSRSVDLAAEPQFLQLAVHTAFFRRDLLVAAKVWFDPLVRVFEDGKFVAQYLLAADDTRIFVDCDAHYLYQVRADGSGALASSGSDLVTRYLTTANEVYLGLLQTGLPGYQAPAWLQYMVLYDLYWLFAAGLRLKDPIHGAPPELLSSLSMLVREVLGSFSYDVLLSFNIVKVRPEIRGAWLAANAGEISQRWVRRYRFDPTIDQIELRYMSASRTDDDAITVDGELFVPSYSKWRGVRFFNEVWLFERILWAPAEGEVRLVAGASSDQAFVEDGTPASDGHFSELFGWRQPVRPQPLLLGTKNDAAGRRKFARMRAKTRRAWHKLINKAAVLPPISNIYRNLWILMDRDTQANDNAEALYRYLSVEQADVNARFVIRKGTSDYRRLRAEGFKILPYGSIRHFLGVRNASHIISSHIDEYVVRPFKKRGVSKTWNYVFLQHGVTQNDLSRWLNTKDVQQLITTTEQESRAFVEDDGPYIFTAKEIRLTGFPRHDRLVSAMKEAAENGERRTILIMPTWRSYLLDERNRVGNTRSADEAFGSSEYVRQWSDLLGDESLVRIARDHDLELVLLPHPNLEPHLKYFSLPEEISVASYQNGSIASYLANAEVTMTDYSSQAFEGAFCHAPCVYFQFDREEFFGGLHIGSPGYFDVQKDGFGPVTETVDAALSSLEELLLGETEQVNEYRERVASLYPERDGYASRRTYEAISELIDRRERRNLTKGRER